MRSTGSLRRRLLAGTCSLAAFAVLGTTPAMAQDAQGEPAKYQPFGEIVAHAGSDETGVAIEGWLPLVQGDSALLFVDGRIGATSEEDYYTNLGLGVRAIVGDSVVIGGYGYFDFTRDELDKDFYGATFGAEVLTPRFELRANYYLPTTENRYLGTEIEPAGTLTIEDNEILERRDTMRFDLSSMKGVDAEAGVKLFGADDGSQDFRVFGGGYHYWDSQLDDVDGGYGEAEYRLHGLFGEGSLLSLAGRVSDDNWRGTEVSGQVRLRIAFGKPRGPARSLTGLESRMTERVRRRGTIVSQVRATPGTQDYNVTNSLTGSAFGQFYFADGGNTLGTGDPSDPTTLGDAATRADAGDYIVAEGGHGDIATTGVTLADDVSLVGGGSTTLSVRLSGGSVVPYTLGTTAGTIANSDSASDTITLGDGNYLAGFSLTGGANAIAGDGITDVTISDVSISGAAASGISIVDADEVAISGASISGVGEAGISLVNAGLTEISASTITGGSAGGVAITGGGTARLSDLTLGATGGAALLLDGTGGALYVSEFADLTVEGGNGETDGITVVEATFDANPGTLAIETVDGGDLAIGSSTDRVGGGGLVLNGVLGSVAFGDLDIYTDGGDGLYVRDGEGKLGTFAFANTSGTIDAIGGAAVDIDPVTVNSVFDSLTATGGPGAGLIFDTVSGSFTVTGATTVTGTAGPGILIKDSDADFTFGAVDIVDPGADGIEVTGVNGDIVFGDTKITGLGAATGVDVAGAQGNITFKSLDIEGTGAAGSKGIDLSGSTNAGFIGTTGPSHISGVDIGVDLSNAGITGTFQFGDGSDTDTNGAASSIVAGIPIAATNLGITGTYNFLDTELTGDISGLAGDDVEIFFVDSTPGAGTAGDPGTIAQAELSGADIIVLVNDGSGNLDASGSNSDDTFVLASGQQLTGFYGQTSFEYQQSGPQANLQVHGLAAGTTVTVDDPTGNGGATLVSSAGDALTLSGDNLVDHVQIGDATHSGIKIENVTGSVEISDSSVSNLFVSGGSSSVAVVNTDLIGSTATDTLFVGNFHTGTLTIDAASSIAGSTYGIVFNAYANGTYTIDAPVSLTGGQIYIGTAAGTIDFNGAVTLTNTSSSFASALTITGTTGTVSFGTLDIVDPAKRGIEILNSSADVTFADASVNDSASTSGFGVTIQGQDAASTITFDNLDLVRDAATSPDSFNVQNSAGTITVTAGSFSNGSANDLIDIDGGSATISIGATLSDTGTGNGIEIDGVTGGSISFTGNYTKTGTGGGVTIGTLFGTGGAITFGGNVTISGGANIVIEDTDSIAFNGATSVSGATANAVDVSGTNGTVSFANLDIAMTADNTVGLDLNGASFTTGFSATDFDITSTSSTGTLGVDLRNASGVVRLGDIVASGGASASISGVATGVRADNTSDVTFTFGDGENTVDVASVIDAVTTAIDFTGNDGSVGTFNFIDVDWTLASNSLSYQNLLSEFTIYYVDAQGDGNGTAANPGSFDDAGAQSADVVIMVNQNASGTDTIQLNNISQGNIGTVALHDGQGLFSFNGGETINLAQYGYSMGGAPSNFTFTAIAGVGTLIDNPGDGTGAPILTTNNTFNTINIDGGAHVILGGVVVHNDNSFAAVSSGSAASVVIDDSVLVGASYGLSLDLSGNGAATAGIYTISNSSLTGTNNDGLRIVSGAGDSYTLTVTDSSFSGDTGLYAATFNGGTATVSLDGVEATGSGNFGVYINRTSTGGALTVTELEDITVTGGSSGLSVAGASGSAEVTFDADPLTAGLQEVTAGNIHLGTSASPLGMSGLVLANVSGSLEIADLQAHVSSASALVVDNAALETSQPSLGFALSTLDGDLSVAAGTATYNGVFLRAIDADLLLDTVSIVGGDYGLTLDTITGVGTASNALTIADLTIDGTLTGGVVLNAVNGAVTITDGEIGAADDPAGRAVSITGGTGNVSIGADITKASVGEIVYVTGRSTGTIAFSGELSATGGLANGILVTNNTGGAVNFSGLATLATGVNDAITLTSNSGMALNFSGGLDVDTTSGRGIHAVNGGTLTFTGTNTVSTTSGRALNFSNVTIGDAGATFASVDVTSGATQGVNFTNVGQTAGSSGIDILDGSIAATAAGADAVYVSGASADIYVGADLSTAAIAGSTVNVSNAGRTGGQTIEIAGAIDDNGVGIYLDNNDQNGGYATVVLSGTVDIDTAAGATSGLLQQNGGNLTVTGAMDVDVTGNADGIVLNNNGTFTSTFSSTSAAGLTVTSENGNAFESTSGGNISVTAQTSLTATGVGAGLVLAGTNTGNTVTFNAGGTGLDISTQGVGPGLYSIDGSTLSILGTGNSITTNTAQVMGLYNGTIGAGGINFDTLTGTAVLAGFHAIYLENMTGGTVAANTVNVTGGSAGIYVLGAANVDFDTITLTTPANTGIVLNATTGTLDFGDTTITNPSTAGVSVVTSTGGTIHFDDLDIALEQINSVGVSLYGAALGAAITADDFDLTSLTASGTVGIDLTGATGDQTVRFGDTVVGGESASIAGVETGVLFDDVSDINFIFGDGEGTTDVGSSIAALTAIDFTDATGANGTFNFYDVFYPTSGSTDNLENAFDVYWIDQAADGNGSLANPGGFDDTGAANADVLVVVNTDMTQDTIDLAGSAQGSIGSYTMANGQVMVSFNGGDTIDLADYGLVGGGAPANILLTGIVSGGTTLTNPFAGVTPILTTTAAGQNTIALGTGSYWIGGVIIGAGAGNNAGVFGHTFSALTITDSVINGTVYGLNAWFSTNAAGTTSTITVRDSSFSGSMAGLLAISGAGDDIDVDIADSSFSANAGGLAALYLAAEGGPMTAALSGISADGNGGWGVYAFNSGPADFIITDFSDITVFDTAGYALLVGGADGNTELTFDADPDTPGLQAVAGGNLSVSAPAGSGRGLYLQNVAGQLDFGDLDIQSTGFAGLTVNNSALKTSQPSLGFTLTSTSGTINSVGAPALFLDPLTVNMTLDSVSASGGSYGIQLDEVAGTLNILGGSISGTTITGVDINASSLNFGYAGTISNVTGRTVEVTGQSAGTVTFSGVIHENGQGINLTGNTGATINFTGGLDIKSTTNTGFTATGGGVINVTGGIDDAFGSGNRIQTTTGQIIHLDGVTAGADGINFIILKSTGTVANKGIYLNNVDGTTFVGGAVTIAGTSGAASDGIYIGGGSAATFYFDSATIDNTGDEGIEINGASNGTVNFTTIDLDGMTGNGVEILNATGAVNINGGSIGMTNDPAARGVYVSGGTGDVSIAAAIYKSSSGEPVWVDNHETGTVTFSGNIASFGPASPLTVTNSNSGTVNFTGQSITLNPVGDNGVFLNSNAGGTINFAPVAGGTGLDIVTTNGFGFYANSGGTITVTGNDNSISTTTGPIILLDGVSAGTGGINFVSLGSTSATVAGFTPIYLNNLDGTSFNGGTVNIVGTGAGIDGIFIGGGSAATFDFTSATIANTGDEGIEINGAGNGAVTFGTVAISNATGNGVVINGATNAVNINGGSIGAASGGWGVYVTGGTGAISIASNITKTSAGKVVEIDNHETGTVTFSGTITGAGGFDNGILIQNVNSGTVNFTGDNVTLNTGANTAVSLLNNASGTINFNLTGTGLDIVTTSGLGFNASGGGTIAITGSSNSIETNTSGRIIALDGVSAGTGGINFAGLIAYGTVTNTAISLNNLDGSTFNGGVVSIVGASGDGIWIGGGSAAAITFGATSIAGTGDEGIEINASGGASGAINFGATTITNGENAIEVNGGNTGDITFASATINGVGGDGIYLNGIGTTNFAVNGGNIGNSNDPGVYGVRIVGGSGTVSIAANITKTSSFNVVNVQNRTGGTVTFSGNISATGNVNNGIMLTGNAGTIVFSGSSKVLTTATSDAVTIANNTANIDFINGGLVINTTNGTGMSVGSTSTATGGTLTVSGSGNTITTTTGIAFVLNGTDSDGITFQSISKTGGSATGIYIKDAGTGGFTVTGTASTAASGGIISGITGTDGQTTTGVGVYIENTSNITLNNMSFNGLGNYAIRGEGVVNFTLRDSVINGTSGTAVGEAAIYFHNLTGLAIIEGNAISGGYSDNMRILNDAVSGTLNLYVRDSANDAAIFGSNGTTNDGNDSLNVEVSGDGNLFMLVDGVSFTGWRGDAVQVTTLGTANSEITVRNSTFANTHSNIASGGGIGVLLTGTSSGAGWGVDYSIEDNTFTGSKGYAIAASFFGSYNGVIRGFIDGNTIGTSGGGYTGVGSSEAGGILARVERSGVGSGTLTQYVTISNNSIYDVAQMGINVAAVNGASLADNAVIEATITGNIVTEMGGPSSYAALYMLAGGGGGPDDFSIVRASIASNVFNFLGTTGGYAPIYFDQLLGTSAQYQFLGYVGTDGDNADIINFLTGLSNTMTPSGSQLDVSGPQVFSPDAVLNAGSLATPQNGSNTSLPTGG